MSGVIRKRRIVLCSLSQYKTGRSDSRVGLNGASPSGKASVFGTDIPRFEILAPQPSPSEIIRRHNAVLNNTENYAEASPGWPPELNTIFGPTPWT